MMAGHWRMLLLVVACILACEPVSSPPSRVFVVAIDDTGSFVEKRGKAVTRDYFEESKKACERLVDELTPGDEIIVFGLSENSLRGKPFVPLTTLPKAPNSLDQVTVLSAKKALRDSIAAIRLPEKAKTSDVYGAIRRAADFLANAGGSEEGKRKYFIICSDMQDTAKRGQLGANIDLSGVEVLLLFVTYAEATAEVGGQEAHWREFFTKARCRNVRVLNPDGSSDAALWRQTLGKAVQGERAAR